MSELSYASQVFANECDQVRTQDNTAYPNTYKQLALPYDDEGYCQAFSLDQEEEYMAFFEKYGVVVIKDLLMEEECAKSECECWDFIERHSHDMFKVDRNDPGTWEYWPGLKKLGILSNEVVLSKQFFENRQNPKVYQVFTKLLGSKELFSNTGRASAMRPTKAVRVSAASAVKHLRKELTPEQLQSDQPIAFDMPQWKTVPEWLHLDLSPWTGQTTAFGWKTTDWRLNKGYHCWKTQSSIALVDCGPNDGGFHCVPGFQHHIRGWANANMAHFSPNEHIGSVQIPKEDPMRQDVCTVPVRKGSLIVWMSMIPHGTFPNDSEHGRMIQYLGFARCDDSSIRPLYDTEDIFPSDWEPSPLGRKLFGFDPWTKQ